MKKIEIIYNTRTGTDAITFHERQLVPPFITNVLD